MAEMLWLQACWMALGTFLLAMKKAAGSNWLGYRQSERSVTPC